MSDKNLNLSKMMQSTMINRLSWEIYFRLNYFFERISQFFDKYLTPERPKTFLNLFLKN